MTTGAVPVASHGLGIESGADAVCFTGSIKQPTCYPELIGDLESRQRTDLELPLARHDLSVDTGDAQAGLDTSVEVSLDNIAAEDLIGADAAVVAALRRWEAVLGKA